MRKPTFVSFGRVAGVAAVPLALALMAQPASAQWHAQQQQQQVPQQQRYPQGRATRQSSGGAREIFEWQGMVDKEVRVQMEGSRTAVMAIGNNERGLGRARGTSGVPSQPGYVTAQMVEGRGRVDVVQQPSANNGYTTIVRVRDPQSGGAPYRIAAYWQPTGNYGAYDNTGNYGTYGTYGDNGVYSNGRGNDRGNDRANGQRDRDDGDDQGYQGNQGNQGNDNGNHKDRGRHRGQRKHGDDDN